MEYFCINSINIPKLGFGIHHLDEGILAEETVYNAIKWGGWRLLETAGCFQNERSLGLGIQRAINEGVVARKDLFISSKIQDEMQGFEYTKESFENSLNKLQVDYIDLYGIRRPLVEQEDWKTPLIDSWRALEDLYKDGKIKILTVSNFAPMHLNFLLENAEIKPLINQLEIYPRYQQIGLQKYTRNKGLIVGSWVSLDYGRACYDNVIIKLSEKYNKTPAQIILRWHIQKEHLTMTRTTQINRMRENIDIFDYSLDEKDMKLIDDLNDKHLKSENWPTEAIRKHGGTNE